MLRNNKNGKRIISSLIISIIMLTTFVSTAFADEIGLCVHLTNDSINDTVLSKVIESGTNMVRTDILWSEVETVKGELKIPQKIIKKIDTLNNAGVEVLVILDYGNTLYDGIDNIKTLPVETDNDYFQAWLNYVEYVTTQLKGKVVGYEVWNEPDISSNGATGEAYAQLVKATYNKIKNIDNSAKVVAGVLAGDEDFRNAMLGTDVAKYMDVFSFHCYASPNSGLRWYNNTVFMDLETALDKAGFEGEIWLTETGSYTGTAEGAVTEDMQAVFAIRCKAEFDEFLYKTNRTGRAVNYQILDSYDAANKEHNFGILNYNGESKPAYNAILAFNKAVNGKKLISVTNPQSASVNSKLYYGNLNTYSDDRGTTYVAYDYNDRSDTKIAIPLSGDIAYIYDYQGNLTQTILNPNGTKSFAVSAKPVIIECAKNSSTITGLSYDENKNIMTVRGQTTGLNGVITIELLNDDKVVQSETTTVLNRKFNKSFTVDADGDYTVRVARTELSAIGSNLYDEKNIIVAAKNPEIKENVRKVSADTVVVYNKEDNALSISGSLEGYSNGDRATIVVAPSSIGVNDITITNVSYIGEVATSNGVFTVNIEMPDDAQGEYNVYISGTNVGAVWQNSVNAAEVSPYVHVCSFNVDDNTSTVTATANVKNFNNIGKNATIIIAQFADEGKLLAVKMKTFNVDAYTYNTVEKTFAVEKEPDAKTVKAMVWDSYEGMRPLYAVQVK